MSWYENGFVFLLFSSGSGKKPELLHLQLCVIYCTWVIGTLHIKNHIQLFKHLFATFICHLSSKEFEAVYTISLSSLS